LITFYIVVASNSINKHKNR